MAFIKQLAKCFEDSVWNPTGTPQGKFCQSLKPQTRNDFVKILTLAAKGDVDARPPPDNVTMSFLNGTDFFSFLPLWFVIPMTKDTLDTDISLVYKAADAALKNASDSGLDTGLATNSIFFCFLFVKNH